MLTLAHNLWLEVQTGLYDGAADRRPIREHRSYGHLTEGGIELRIDSTFPPVRRPKVVPRS